MTEGLVDVPDINNVEEEDAPENEENDMREYSITRSEHIQCYNDQFENSRTANLLEQVWPELVLTQKAEIVLHDIMTRFMHVFIHKLNEVISQLSRDVSRRYIVSVKNTISTAMSLVGSTDWGGTIYKEVQTVLSRIPENIQNHFQEISQLTLKISYIRRFIRENIGESEPIVPIILTTIVEYIMAELLEMAGNLVKSEARTRVTCSDIQSSIEYDGDLRTLFIDNCGIIFWKPVGPPYIIYNGKRAENREKLLQNVLEICASKSPLFSYTKFAKLIEGILGSYARCACVSKNATLILRRYTEAQAVSFLKKCRDILELTGSVTLSCDCVAKVYKTFYGDFGDPSYSFMQSVFRMDRGTRRRQIDTAVFMQSISRPLIKRLALIAGIYRINSGTYDEIRGFIRTTIVRAVYNCALCMYNTDSKNLTTNIVINGISNCGYFII